MYQDGEDKYFLNSAQSYYSNCYSFKAHKSDCVRGITPIEKDGLIVDFQYQRVYKFYKDLIPNDKKGNEDTLRSRD